YNAPLRSTLVVQALQADVQNPQLSWGVPSINFWLNAVAMCDIIFHVKGDCDDLDKIKKYLF
ncbi:MAG: hypothetical protein LBR35_02560, partial [Rickettsiales bacterium]|nr:hypothetical protein [Rickettsiales bacterium]